MTLPNMNGLMNLETPRTRYGSRGACGMTVRAERLCPECGADMIEFDRLAEDEAVFIWYTCTRTDCTGQWLTKKALRMCGA